MQADQPPQSWLTDRQRRIVAAGLTVLAASVVVAAVVFVLNALLRLLTFVKPVVLPLMTAAVLALLFRPYFQWIRRWVKRDALALILFFVSISIPVLAIIGGAGVLAVDQILGLVNSLPQTLTEMKNQLWMHFPRLKDVLTAQNWFDGVNQAIDTITSQMRAVIIEFASGSQARATGLSLLSFVTRLFTWAVLPVYLGFFLLSAPMEGDRLEPFLPFLKEKTRRNIVYLANQFLDMLVSFFRGQVIVAVIQGVLFGIGFGVVGLRYGFIIGFILGLLNIIPYLGNIIGLSVVLPMAVMQGGVWMLVFCLAVFCAVQCIDGYFITPRIMGNRTGLHPVAVIFSLLFWGLVLDGMMGLMLGIPLSAFVVAVWRLVRQEYLENISDLV